MIIKIVKDMLRCKTKQQMYSKPWKALMNMQPTGSYMRIAIVNTPCMGFGDIVFAMKLYTYLVSWYPNAEIHILTTQPQNFIKLGANPSSIVKLSASSKSSDQCRRVARLYITDNGINIPRTDRYNLILVAPITADFEIDRKDIRDMFSNSTPFNTFFFSEYNDSVAKNFDFPTGVGNGRMGLLFTDSEPLERLAELQNPYSLIYITDNDDHSVDCYTDFIKMVTIAQMHPVFDIVVPSWVANDIQERESSFFNTITTYYKNIQIVNKTGIINLRVGKGPTLRFRNDILPLPYKQMQALYMYSQKQLLVTGDQSITDVLSCCNKRLVPFYQIVPWKTNFARNLSRKLPQKFIQKMNTSCGSIQAINYSPDMSVFMETNDFRINAKPKLDGIVASLSIPELQNIMYMVHTGKSTKSIKNKLKSIIE